MSPTLELLHVQDCPNLPRLLERIAEVTDAPVTTREIGTEVEAATYGMAGSPTLLVNGVDPFAGPGERQSSLSCRLYRDEEGRSVPVPSADQLRSVLSPSVLSLWRRRATPLDQAEEAMHQAVLRAFAATGQPPTVDELDAVVRPTGRSTADLLAALHDLDAIRLAADGGIAVAYPFSAVPTRHRVRVGATHVYAMCAIDALGISAMLGQATRIESVDATTGAPITVTMPGDGDVRWEPADAVVFVGAISEGGPSVDCCCDYLNFFTDRAAATAWMAAHPHVPGQILGRTEAEELGSRLFGPLLTPG